MPKTLQISIILNPSLRALLNNYEKLKVTKTMLDKFLTSPISLIGFNLVVIFPMSLYPFNCLTSGSVFSQLAISASKLYICAPVCNAGKGFKMTHKVMSKQ